MGFHFFALLISLFVSAQDNQTYMEDCVKISAAYAQKDNLSFNIDYKSFDTDLAHADTSFTGKFKFKKGKFYCKVGRSETYKNEKYYLAIDHEQKMMMLNTASSIPHTFLPVQLIDTFILRQKPSIKKVDLDAGKSRRYILVFSDEAPTVYKTVTVDFDLQTYLVKRVSIVLKDADNPYDEAKYLKQPVVEMIYKNYQQVELADLEFSIAKYVTVVDAKHASLKNEFDDYTLINSIAITQEIR